MRSLFALTALLTFATPAWAQAPAPASTSEAYPVTATDQSRITESFSTSMFRSMEQCNVPYKTEKEGEENITISIVNPACLGMHRVALDLMLKDYAKCAATRDPNHCRDANHTREMLQRLFILNGGDGDPITE